MSEPKPIMYVFAGNNGSGKSTIRNLIFDRLGVCVNIDPILQPDAWILLISLGNPILNIERVVVRVQNGGHYIASEDIQKRHITSIQNLLAHLELIDHLVVIDNNNFDGEIVLEAERIIKYKKNPLPNGVILIAEKLSD